MASHYSVSFLKIVKEFNLEEVWAPDDVDTVRIETNELNRPGLPFTGFYNLFDPSRIQIIGKTEYSYLKSLGGKAIANAVDYDEELREFRARDCSGFIPSEKYSGSTGATFKRLSQDEFVKMYAPEEAEENDESEESDELFNAAEPAATKTTTATTEINEEGDGNE